MPRYQRSFCLNGRISAFFVTLTILFFNVLIRITCKICNKWINSMIPFTTIITENWSPAILHFAYNLEVFYSFNNLAKINFHQPAWHPGQQTSYVHFSTEESNALRQTYSSFPKGLHLSRLFSKQARMHCLSGVSEIKKN